MKNYEGRNQSGIRIIPQLLPAIFFISQSLLLKTSEEGRATIMQNAA